MGVRGAAVGRDKENPQTKKNNEMFKLEEAVAQARMDMKNSRGEVMKSTEPKSMDKDPANWTEEEEEEKKNG